jgi:hypothetical protein
MRPVHDRRPAKYYKADRIRTLAAETEVAVVVDDDPAVAAELTRHGWPVYLADWVPRSETLDAAQEEDGRT